MKKQVINIGAQLSRKDMKRLNGGAPPPPSKKKYYCDCPAVGPPGYACSDFPYGSECLPTCCTYVGLCSATISVCWSL